MNNSGTIGVMVRLLLQRFLNDMLHNAGFTSNVLLERPQDKSHGDFTTNIAYSLAKHRGEPPQKIAEDIIKLIEKNKPSYIEKVQVAGGGFINFSLSVSELAENSKILIKEKKITREPRVGLTKLELYENTGPNTNKPLHIGHLRNAALGVSIVNLRKTLDHNALSVNINNDRGAHICKAMIGYLYKGRKVQPQLDVNWRLILAAWIDSPGDWLTPDDEEGSLNKTDHFVGNFYKLGNDFEETHQSAKMAIAEMLQAWEDGDELVRTLWLTMNQWFYEGFRQTHARFLGIKPTDQQFDKEWYESELYQAGKEIITDNLGKGIFVKREDDAIIAKLEQYELPDKVVLRSDGTAIYLTFDLELAKQAIRENKADLFAHIVGNEQDLYFKQLFAICEGLRIGKRENFLHISYGMIRLKGGRKMSSREGTVVTADELMDAVKDRIIGAFQSPNEETTEAIAIGAIKYWMLKYNSKANIEFDIDQSVSVEGNSGPYLQYTYARTASLLSKGQKEHQVYELDKITLLPEEVTLLRVLYQASAAVADAAEKYAPHLLANYLFELAQTFNTFYQTVPILKGDDKQVQSFRLALTESTGIVLQDGLGLLGIKTPERM